MRLPSKHTVVDPHTKDVVEVPPEVLANIPQGATDVEISLQYEQPSSHHPRCMHDDLLKEFSATNEGEAYFVTKFTMPTEDNNNSINGNEVDMSNGKKYFTTADNNDDMEQQNTSITHDSIE